MIHGVGQKHAALLSSKVHAGTGHALLILSQRSIVRAALLVPGPLLAQHPLLHLLPHLLQLLWRAEVAVLAVLRLQATLFEPPLPQAQAPQPLPFLFLPSLLPVHSLVVHEQQTQCLRGLWLDSPIPSSKHILLYLVHGTRARPRLQALNFIGETPGERAAREGAHDVAEALGWNLHGVAAEAEEGAGGEELAYGALGYLHGEASIEPRMFAFMPHAPLRTTPASAAPRPWPLRASWRHALIMASPLAPYVFTACGVGVLASLGLGLALALASAIAACAGAPDAPQPSRPPRLPAQPAEQPSQPPVPALAALLVGMVLAAGLSHGMGLLPYARGAAAPPAYLTLLLLCAFWHQWFKVTWADPGLLPGADSEAYRWFWLAFEKMPVGRVAPDGFCERSELVMPPRAAYSKLSGGAVRCFDHDCPWVGGAVGAGNHASFVSMCLLGEGAVLLWAATLCLAGPPPPFASWLAAMLALEAADDADHPLDVAMHAAVVRVRVLGMGVPLLMLLLMMLTPLVLVHCYLALYNLTTREQIHWMRRQKSTTPPMPPLLGAEPSAEWQQYAPYDHGCVANLRLFWRGQRDELDSPTDGPSASPPDLELGDLGLGGQPGPVLPRDVAERARRHQRAPHAAVGHLAARLQHALVLA